MLAVIRDDAITTCEMSSRHAATFHFRRRDFVQSFIMLRSLPVVRNVLSRQSLRNVRARAQDDRGAAIHLHNQPIAATPMNFAPALASLRAYSLLQRRGVPQSYDEATFRHFLALERRRAKYQSRSAVLVLVAFRRGPGASVHMATGVATALFSGLAHCVREVDFIGWYREGRVAGAVLAQGAEPPRAALRQIGERVMKMTSRRVPEQLAEHLKVRVIPLRGGRKC